VVLLYLSCDETSAGSGIKIVVNVGLLFRFLTPLPPGLLSHSSKYD